MSEFHHLFCTVCLVPVPATPEGLTSSEALERLAKCGPNCPPEVRTRGGVQAVSGAFPQCADLRAIGTAVITVAMEHWVDTRGILDALASVEEGAAPVARNMQF